MIGFSVIALQKILDSEKVPEERIKKILSSFSCPLNPDVETFLKNSAIPYERQGISRTFLVYASVKEQAEMVGYFSLAMKNITVPTKRLSKGIQKRLGRFATRPINLKEYQLSSPLIGQLSKNYTDGLNRYISGDELLGMALDMVRKGQLIFGGKHVYIECEEKEQLLSFYEQHGFVRFNKRELDKESEKHIQGKYLVQMIKYIR